MGGCYSASAALRSRVCRETRDGACRWYAKKDKTDSASARVIKVGAEGNTCEEASSSNEETGKCKKTKCDVTIGGNPYCSQCSKNDDHLADGKCVATDAANACTAKTSAADGTCASCAQGYFLHKGGCYQFGGEAGKLICTDLSTSDGSLTAGACTTCAPGYFKNPTVAAADKPPCIACNDTTGDGTSMGKAGCATCEPPNPSGAATCLTCLDGYYNSGSESSVTCAECNAACATCTGSGDTKCTSCKEADKYLKTDYSAGTSQCVIEAACKQGGTHFPTTDANQKKICTLCSDAANGGITDCQECTPKTAVGLAEAPSVTCSACTTEGKKPNADGTKCVDCVAAGCAKCSDEGVCVECDSSKYLTPTKQCVDSCNKLWGYYKDSNNVCQPCDPSCASCSTAGAGKCSACPAGKVLKYTDETPINGGSCVDECRTGAGGCADCGAVIGSSKYCSKCGNANQAPLNGNCTTTTRAVASCEQIDNGACKKCANGYFLLDGECYQTSRQPGKSVCTTANNGQCQMCDNGQSLSSGICPACPADARSVVTQTLVLSASLDTIFLLIHV